MPGAVREPWKSVWSLPLQELNVWNSPMKHAMETAEPLSATGPAPAPGPSFYWATSALTWGVLRFLNFFFKNENISLVI